MDSYCNVTGTNIMEPFRKRSKKLMRALMSGAPRLTLGREIDFGQAKGSAMPAYAQPHYLQSDEALFYGSVETPPVVCPDCIGVLPMVMRDVEPHWAGVKIDFIYECSDCGAEVRHTLTKPN